MEVAGRQPDAQNGGFAQWIGSRLPCSSSSKRSVASSWGAWGTVPVGCTVPAARSSCPVVRFVVACSSFIASSVSQWSRFQKEQAACRRAETEFQSVRRRRWSLEGTSPETALPASSALPKSKKRNGPPHLQAWGSRQAGFDATHSPVKLVLTYRATDVPRRTPTVFSNLGGGCHQRCRSPRFTAGHACAPASSQ